MFFASEVSIDWDDSGWRIYRYDEDGNVSQVVLPTEAMDQLRLFFRSDYAECRSETEKKPDTCPRCGAPTSSSVEDFYCAELCGWSRLRAPKIVAAREP